MTRSRPTEWEQAYNRLKRKGVGDNDARQHPAVGVCYKEAMGFSKYLPGSLLPTEAQWEFAARSQGLKRRYVWGNAPAPSRERANIEFQEDLKTTAPVRSYPADVTLQGVYDMTGNVREICRDGWTSSYRRTEVAVVDPFVPPAEPTMAEYTIRGAGYDSLPPDCSITRRDDRCLAADAFENLGFRLVVECPDTRKPR